MLLPRRMCGWGRRGSGRAGGRSGVSRQARVFGHGGDYGDCERSSCGRSVEEIENEGEGCKGLEERGE